MNISTDMSNTDISEYFKKKLCPNQTKAINCEKWSFVDVNLNNTGSIEKAIGVTDDKHFVHSSGIVNIKLINGNYNINDIIVPGVKGCGRLATEEEIYQCTFKHYLIARIVGVETIAGIQLAKCLLC